jgi:hypothetical protein
MCMYLHVSWMYHVGMCRNVMLCTLTFALTVSLGCIHDNVHSDAVHLAHHCQGQIGTKRMYLPSPEPVCPLFYINMWAMVWPNYYPALAI